MIGFIVVLNFFILVFVILTFRSAQQHEYLLTKIKVRLNGMASKADLDAAIAGLNQTITDEATKLQAAIDALAAAVANGQDLTQEIADIQAAQTRIAGLPTTPTVPTP